MFDVKDPAIKLFGRTIPLQEIQTPVESGKKYDQDCQIPAPEFDYKDKCIETTKSEANEFPKEDPCNVDKSSSLNNGKEDAQIPTTEENKATIEEDQVDTNMSSQEKVLKKPDKILPCPRCNSMDTKFCYYNNYNVNQPRHFCKNCQRYWTAGGTMRNVPVGAGRRKNKHMVSQYRHMMSSEGMPTTTRVDIPDATNQQVLLSSGLSLPPNPIINGNGRVLKFGPDAPLCESMATMLSLGDQKIKVETSGEDPSCGSSGTASTCHKTEFPENMAQMEHDGIPGYCNGLTPAHPLQCYPLPPWVYLDWNNIAPMAAGQGSSDLGYVSNNGNPNPVQLGPTSMMAGPAFCSPSIPFPFVPASYWGCMPSWAARVWSAPQIGCDGSISPSSSNGSPTLGKHSRDAKSNGEEKMEKSFWVPKTLRIDNPDEAAKSSIWDTLGIKPQPNEPITKGGIVKVFQPKIEDNCHASDATQVLQANPAALSRSQTFQETT